MGWCIMNDMILRKKDEITTMKTINRHLLTTDMSYIKDVINYYDDKSSSDYFWEREICIW